MTMRHLRRTRCSLVVALGVCLCAAALVGCSSGVGASGGDTGYISGKGVVTTVDVADRKTPGDLSGETLDGTQVSLADLSGKTVVVNVWGSWCPPCRAEADDLVTASKRLADSGVVFLGIDSRDPSRAAAKAFVRRFDVPYPSLYDPSGRALLAFRGTLTPNAIPSTVVIDDSGRIAARVLGPVSTSTLVGLVEDVQAHSAGSAAGAR
jgi:thiol-disulfide isomerase/thioredoxin